MCNRFREIRLDPEETRNGLAFKAGKVCTARPVCGRMGAQKRAARRAQIPVRDQLAGSWKENLFRLRLARQAVLPGKLMRAPISVIIPCYRCTQTIERAVASIARQTLAPEEVLLVEDYSDDEGKTLDLLYRLLQKYQDGICLKIISLENNGGPAVARNAGWNAATQPYIAFLDADDEWYPEKLEIQYRYMRENPKIAVTGHQHILSLDGKPALCAVSTASYTNTNISPLSLLFKNCFPTSSVMLKKDNVPFRFTAKKRYCEDFFLWQQLAFAGFPIVRIEALLLHYYKALYGEGGLSAQLWKMEMGELSNLVALYRAGSINLLLFVAATGFSIAKHVKRLAVTWISRLMRRVSGRAMA